MDRELAERIMNTLPSKELCDDLAILVGSQDRIRAVRQLFPEEWSDIASLNLFSPAFIKRLAEVKLRISQPYEVSRCLYLFGKWEFIDVNVEASLLRRGSGIIIIPPFMPSHRLH